MRRFVLGAAILAVAFAAPVVAQADDREISQTIVNRLQQLKRDGELRKFTLDLRVDQGVVWLEGKVASREHRQKALDAARHVDGVKRVVNGIDIRDAEKASPTSTTTTAQDTSPPTAEKDTEPAQELEAEHRGLLELLPTSSQSGAKPHTQPKATARPKVTVEPVAAQNRPNSSVSDDQVAERIISQLQSLKDSGKLRKFGIDVNVLDGDVWLKGHVADQAQRDLVINAARHVRGVQQVVNDLSVKGSTVNAVPASRQTPLNAPLPANPKPLADPSDAGPANDTEGGQQATPQPVSGAAPHGSPAATATPYGQMPMAHPHHGGHMAMAQHHGGHMAMAQHHGGHMAMAHHHGGQMPMAHHHGGHMPMAHHGGQMPMPFARAHTVNHATEIEGRAGPMHVPSPAMGMTPTRFDQPQMPGHAWPSYAPHPNYAAVTYPQQYSAAAWPYIGPFYPYPQVPLGWRRVSLEWDDGWWFLDFKSK